MIDASFDFLATMRQLETGKLQLDALPESQVREMESIMGMDRARISTHLRMRSERERNVPGPGDAAPGFNLELLDAAGNRSGRFTSLQQNLDKPVALIFGSYT